MKRNLFKYFGKNILMLLGVVLIWRGAWHLLDALDAWLFGGEHLISAIGGIIVGFLILFLPDKDLKELDL